MVQEVAGIKVFTVSFSEGFEELRVFRPAMRINPSIVCSFDRRNLSTLMLLNAHVSNTLARIRCSFNVLSL
jgi:hypothetical protein